MKSKQLRFHGAHPNLHPTNSQNEHTRKLTNQLKSNYLLPSNQIGLQTFEYFYMALKIVLQDCNGFSNNPRRRDNLKGFFSLLTWKPKSFKCCIWTIKSISSYIWLIFVKQLHGLKLFLKEHSSFLCIYNSTNIRWYGCYKKILIKSGCKETKMHLDIRFQPLVNMGWKRVSDWQSLSYGSETSEQQKFS